MTCYKVLTTFCMSTLAPCCSNVSTTLECPFWAAYISAVHPSCQFTVRLISIGGKKMHHNCLHSMYVYKHPTPPPLSTAVRPPSLQHIRWRVLCTPEMRSFNHFVVKLALGWSLSKQYIIYVIAIFQREWKFRSSGHVIMLSGHGLKRSGLLVMSQTRIMPIRCLSCYHCSYETQCIIVCALHLDLVSIVFGNSHVPFYNN